MGNKVSSLHRASISGRFKDILRHLEDGADPNDSRIAPLHAAVLFGHMDIVNALLDAGVRIDTGVLLDDARFPGYSKMCHPFPSTATQFTPLGCALLKNDLQMVLTLLKRGASPNGTADTLHPLDVAIRSRASPAIIKALVEAGSASSDIDFARRAILECHLDAVNALWDAKVMTDPTKALDALIDHGIKGYPFVDIDDMVDWLLHHGADVRQLPDLVNRLLALRSTKVFDALWNASRHFLV